MDVLMTLSDAGNGNAQKIKMDSVGLKGKYDEYDFIKEEQCSHMNRYDNSKKVYDMLCFSHLLKSLRNQLCTAGKEFVHKGETINWKNLIDILNRDKTRDVPRTRLSDDALYLDGFSKMRVEHAKNIFAYKTIVEPIVYFCEQTKNTEILSKVNDSSTCILELVKP